VEDIIEGMSEEEIVDVFPDYDQIVWLDRDESVQELMENDEDAKSMVQKSSGTVKSKDMASQDSIDQGDMSTTESEGEVRQNWPSEDSLSEQEMYEVLVHHSTAVAVSESSDAEINYSIRKGTYLEIPIICHVFTFLCDLSQNYLRQNFAWKCDMPHENCNGAIQITVAFSTWKSTSLLRYICEYPLLETALL
jgi:hypothetical protein